MNEQAQSPTPVMVLRSLPQFRSVVSDSFVPLSVHTDSTEFRASVRSGSLESMHVVEIAADPHLVERTDRLISRDVNEPCYKVSLMLQGTGTLIQDGRQAILRTGDLAIYDTTRPYTLAFDERFRSIVAMFPQRLLDVPGPQLGSLTATTFSRGAPMAAMVGPMLQHLAGSLEQLSGATGLRLMHNVVDLVSTLVQDHASQPQSPLERVLTQAHAYVNSHLDDPDLSPTTIAHALHVSVRHLHAAFEHGPSVSTVVREARLSRCCRDLGDPARMEHTVASIAARWGFMDAAHFSRMFKAHFGEPPSEFRRRVLRMHAVA